MQLKELPWGIRFSEFYRGLIDKTLKEQTYNEEYGDTWFEEENNDVPQQLLDMDIIDLKYYFEDSDKFHPSDYNDIGRVIEFANFIMVDEFPKFLKKYAIEEDKQDGLINILDTFEPTRNVAIVHDLINLLVENTTSIFLMKKLFFLIEKNNLWNTNNYSLFLNNRTWLFLMNGEYPKIIEELKYTTSFLDAIGGPLAAMGNSEGESEEYNIFLILIDWIELPKEIKNNINERGDWQITLDILNFLADSNKINFNRTIKYSVQHVYDICRSGDFSAGWGKGIPKFNNFYNPKDIKMYTIFNFLLDSIINSAHYLYEIEKDIQDLIIKIVKNNDINLSDSVDLFIINKDINDTDTDIEDYLGEIYGKSILIKALSETSEFFKTQIDNFLNKDNIEPTYWEESNLDLYSTYIAELKYRFQEA